MAYSDFTLADLRQRFGLPGGPTRPGPGNPHFQELLDELVIDNRDWTAEELQGLIKQ
jgi:hypothetical protein